jgi:protein tyrosine/serine phosphatase
MEKAVALTKPVNFRDVGDLPTEDGRRIRHGRLFRSDSLQELDDTDIAALVDRLRVRYVIDLRTAGEAVQQGRGPLSRYPVAYLNVPLIDVDAPLGPPGQIVLNQYLEHLKNDPNLPLAVEMVAHAVRHPTVVHCAAGKDRTGVVLALVELLLGVPEEHVVADYMTTAVNMDAIVGRLRQWQRYADNMARLPAEIYRCEEHVIRGLLRELDSRYGGARQWALERGIAADIADQLRDRLLV